MPTPDASMCNMNSLLGSGLTNAGSDVRSYLSCLKA